MFPELNVGTVIGGYVACVLVVVIALHCLIVKAGVR